MTLNPVTLESDAYYMGDPSRGAAMGRPRGVLKAHEMPQRSIYLNKVKLDRQGYDSGGAYWGTPNDLYCAYGDTEEGDYCEYVRASSRAEAASKLRLSEQLIKRTTEEK